MGLVIVISWWVSGPCTLICAAMNVVAEVVVALAEPANLITDHCYQWVGAWGPAF